MTDTKIHSQNNKLFANPRRPYYIDAPAYRQNSAGIRVMHYLCHALNMTGEEAYVYTDVTNPALRTPTLTQKDIARHGKIGVIPITVYPEVISGNPRRAASVVRYLLNKPGLLGSQIKFDENDLLFAYGKGIYPEAKDNILLLPPIDSSIFFPPDSDYARHGTLFYPGRYREATVTHADIAKGATIITGTWPATPHEMAELLRKSELLYCFENTAIAGEAVLCGCPVVIMNSPYFSGHSMCEEELGRYGAAYGNTSEEIAYAKSSVHLFAELYARKETEFWEKLVHFIDTSQAMGQSKQHDEAVFITDPNYCAWLTRTSLQEIDGQLLAERMIKKWQHRPKFNIVLEARLGEENLLADTIDSIAAQWYPDWHLTLVTEFHPADTSLAELPQVTWAVRAPDESIKQAMDEMIASIPADWLLLIEPGCTLEAHALAYFADTVNFAPDSCLIYCDEDVRNEAGELASPRFKPDFNLELLRNMYYLGPALAIKKDTFESVGCWSTDPEANLYDLSLRILDACGPTALMHQRDMLLHTPEKTLRTIDPDAEQNALRAHVDRNQIKAKIEPGFLQGTQKVTYPPQGNPLVSIIIPTRDQPGYLSHCIDSIARQTLYPHWELILVDHATQDPDALNYISKLLDTPPFIQRVDVIRTEGEFNYARLGNLGASLAKGEFLLFLDNDTEIIQPSWLGDLLGYLQQPGIAAVAPRLSQPDEGYSLVQSGPRMLGVAGLGSGIASVGTSLLEPGYCGRLQVAQDASALMGSCLMVGANDFHLAGKFNEQDTPVYESVLELCLQLGKNGKRLIWTPWVDVAHHDGVTRKRLENDVLERSRLTAKVLSECNYFYGQHLSKLANDPYYHRHLSLNTAFAVEPNAVIDWDTRFHDRLRILGQPLTSGSGEYRMVAPFRALQKAGLAQANIVHPLGHNIQRVLTPIELARAAPDVLMLQQAIDDTQINQLKRHRRYSPEVFMTYAVDDVLGNLPRKHYLYNYQAREGKSRMREGLAHCNRLIASTEPIAEYCKGMIDDIVVVPNRLEGAFWGHLQSQRGAGKKPRVGWAGAQQHLGDLELIKEVVEALADEVEWVFMGMCPEFLKPYVTEEHAFVLFKDYPAKLASLNLDLAIAPLEQHLFNEGKSNLRLLEYGAMGWPVICTDIYPYQTNNAPVKRLPNDAKIWIEAIRERINDLDATYKEGDALKAWVLKHYILEDHIEEWLRAVSPPNH